MRLLISLLFILLQTIPAYSAATPQVVAQLSSTKFSLHQGSLLSIKVTGDRNPNIILPEIAGIDFHPRGKSSQMSLINGSITSSLSLQYVITASKEGTYSLDGIQVEIDGEIYKAAALSFTVEKAKTPQDEDGEEVAFIETKVKKSVYLGETIPVNIHVFFSGKQKVEINSSPQLLSEDINMKPFTQNPLQQRAQRNNSLYDEIVWSTELSSVSSGTFPISFQLDASILKRQAQSSSLTGFNDPFFPSMFSTTTRIPLKVIGDEEQITILPLPEENQPKDFSGAVGQFTLSVTTKATKADIGEPVQVTMVINGDGNFDLVHTPRIIEDPLWKSYPAQKQEGQHPKQKVFQQVLIAKEGGQLQIPQYSFSYFDPQEKRYRTALSKPTTIEIVGSKSSPRTTENSRPHTEITVEATETTDINLVSQHLEIGPTYQEITPLFFRTWFIAIAALLVIALFFFALHILLSKKRDKNSVYQQKTALYKSLKQESLNIQNSLGENDFTKSQDCLISLLQKYFAFQLQKEALSISAHSLRHLDQDDEIIQIFKNLSSLSYSGTSLSSTELTQMVQVINTRLEEDV